MEHTPAFTSSVANKQCNSSQQYIDINNCISIDLPNLRTKSQLNKIIVNSNGKPDYLAINIYWDTFRSWYNPNKTYTKEDNVLSVTKLKTKGIYTNYQKLSDIHGVSKETIRKKLVKLEELMLTNRSFQHKETVCTKSFNRLIIYVWKNTPYFFNSYGVGQEEVTSLNPQTNYKYIEEKHNIVFNSQALQNKANSMSGGIQVHVDTKELIKPFSKEKDRSMKSNFCKNSFEEAKILQSPTESNCNKTEESRVVTVTQIKNTFAKALELKDFYPLTKEDCQKLQSSSGREFSLNSMNEILLDMSKRLTNRLFNSKKGFLSYMSKVFSYEMRDAVKINNENFKIRNNQLKEEREVKKQEEYLTKIEYSLEVSPEWHFKKRLASVLPRKVAYNLLRAYKQIDIKTGIFYLNLSEHVELTDSEKEIILSQAKSTHEKLDFGDERLGYIQDIKIIMPEKITTIKYINQNKTENLRTKTTTMPTGIWGRVRQSLIVTYGEATDHNWFSKLEAVEDVEKNELKLKAPTSFVKDWIESNYFNLIEKVTNSEQYKVEFC